MISEILQKLTIQSSKLYDTHEIKSILRLSGINAGACSGSTLHFDRLSVLSLSTEAVRSVSALKGGAERRRTGQRGNG
jgi:hypothetical protein